jgi:hypothetical protein
MFLNHDFDALLTDDIDYINAQTVLVEAQDSREIVDNFEDLYVDFKETEMFIDLGF